MRRARAVSSAPKEPTYVQPARFAISIPQFVADGACGPLALHAYLERAETRAYLACTSRLRLGCTDSIACTARSA